MHRQMTDPSETVQAAHDFVENVDWELLEEAADMGAAVVAYMRRHPWMLVALGTTMTGLGVWQMMEKSGNKKPTQQLADLVRR